MNVYLSALCPSWQLVFFGTQSLLALSFFGTQSLRQSVFLKSVSWHSVSLALGLLALSPSTPYSCVFIINGTNVEVK